MSFYLLDHHISRDRPRKDGVGRPWYPSSSEVKRFGLFHTAENLPDFNPPDMGAEAVAKYGATTERASWHWTVDSDSIIPMLPLSYTAFHVMGYNSPSVGVEVATIAAQWVNSPMTWRMAILENTAQVVFKIWLETGIPPVFRTRSEIDAGSWGWTYHSFLDPDRRTDPGNAFPSNWVLARAQDLIIAHQAQVPWYQPYVKEALARGIISPAADLRLDQPATRAEVIAMIVRATS
jgi:hypothetical protein